MSAVSPEFVDAIENELKSVEVQILENERAGEQLRECERELARLRDTYAGSTNGDKPASPRPTPPPARRGAAKPAKKSPPAPGQRRRRRDEAKAEILGMLNSQGEVSAPMAVARLGLSGSTAALIFKELEAEGAIVFARKQGQAKVYAAPGTTPAPTPANGDTDTPLPDPPAESSSEEISSKPVEESEVFGPELDPEPATDPVSSDVEELALQLLADRQYMPTSLGVRLDLDHATTLGMLERLVAAGKVARRSDGYYELLKPEPPAPSPERAAQLAELEEGILGLLAERSRSLSRMSNELGATHTDVSEICERLSGEGILDKLDDYTYTMADPG